jgi:hypothetical protein
VSEEAPNEWPEDWVAKFLGLTEDFERPEQGEPEEREPLD